MNETLFFSRYIGRDYLNLLTGLCVLRLPEAEMNEKEIEMRNVWNDVKRAVGFIVCVVLLLIALLAVLIFSKINAGIYACVFYLSYMI